MAAAPTGRCAWVSPQLSTNTCVITTNTQKIAEWQPGDIVIFEDKHIGIISDRRNKNGIPYVIHNGGQENREEDYLTKKEITGHYRFDASKIDETILKKWK